jgi:hypothetical protein
MLKDEPMSGIHAFIAEIDPRMLMARLLELHGQDISPGSK